MNARFAGGRNIALKVPSHQYDATVQFYRDVLGLKVLENHLTAMGFEFGSKQLWIDRVTGLSNEVTALRLRLVTVNLCKPRFSVAARLCQQQNIQFGHSR